jgi:Ca2+-binding RTX toxin-like protein
MSYGDDTLNGAGGDDLLLTSNGADTFNGGDGVDTVSFANGIAATASLAGGPGNGKEAAHAPEKPAAKSKSKGR